MKKILTIAIGGCSCAGKTTLSKWIEQQHLQTTVLHMDEYYREIDDPLMPWLTEYDGKVANWESLASMDLARFLGDFDRLMQTYTGILVLEGIFVFSIREIQRHLQLRYFMHIPYAMALQRRRMQVFEHPEPEDYFDKVTWPAHLKALQHASTQADIKVFNQHLGYEEIKDTICMDIGKWTGLKEQKVSTEDTVVDSESDIDTNNINHRY